MDFRGTSLIRNSAPLGSKLACRTHVTVPPWRGIPTGYDARAFCLRRTQKNGAAVEAGSGSHGGGGGGGTP